MWILLFFRLWQHFQDGEEQNIDKIFEVKKHSVLNFKLNVNENDEMEGNSFIHQQLPT